MRDSWDRRVRRAEALATSDNPASALLRFYARLLRCQKTFYESLNVARPAERSAGLEADLVAVHRHARTFLRDLAAESPDPIAIDARQLLEAPEQVLDDLMLAYWHAPSDRQFFAKAVLQPYAQWRREIGALGLRAEGPRNPNRCPACGGPPQLSILDTPPEAASDGGGRNLLCSTCLLVWPFRRVVCPHCGEENERQLGYFQSPTFDHLRVDVCDTCKRYLKAVDLTRLGVAVPIVDEVAGASLDLWACQQGYEKIELNLVGL
jgi:FdhE protein